MKILTAWQHSLPPPPSWLYWAATAGDLRLRWMKDLRGRSRVMGV